MRVPATKKLLAPVLVTTLVVGAIMGRPAHADIAPSLEADVSTSFEAVVMQQGGKKKEDDQSTVLSNPFASSSQSYGRTYQTNVNQSWGRPSGGSNAPGSTGSTPRFGTKGRAPVKRPTKWKDRGFVGTRYIPPPLSPLLP